MFKKILLTLVFISAQSIASDDIVEKLSVFFGTKNIEKTQLNGIYEVILENPIKSVFISDGRYLIRGDIIDLKTQQKIPSKAKQLKKALLDNIDEKDKIIFKAENEKYAVHVFTDIDCPFCRKLHAEMPKMNQLGITVKYLASPLASLHPTAQGKMEKIWCAEDPVAAMDNYKKNQVVPDSEPCKNPVAEQLEIAAELSVNGTPAIFLADGTHIPGYLSADSLLKRLESTK
ncbi:Thiol:disulfide interchange protein DsbC [uncultured Candidatus Thioglobus sp.]|nr:Thiol:disulfide interchange protein DsbC [uncultured Candidatus Thioglobus sp.]